ncbi:TKL protein kinase [Saprolegnia parasitica CBS 223.65]|uniref:TKL protein kinase n=1 Tax=Saprolegnia parasitica (strain CBS 223.65) TaxID=695850 RepID=A0A067C5D6_SAPPC|nr:TKL protein kinase [Saprolegnia parasitica CBS 223.65]KDO25698.1 TKL protein kinase [Saprolegnia parasitica CBS 223.65]|eukprot:XP_012203508.1 TKL protein kinase [Saprolegnia parasitica CBS 223.65]
MHPTQSKPVLNPYEARIQQLERELEETKAKLEKEKHERAAEVESLTRRHETELELYAAQVAGARRLGDAASAVVQRLTEVRALHLMQQRLNSVMEVDDATFEYISGPLDFDKRDFPFTRFTPGRLRNGTLVLRIQLENSFKGDEDVLLRVKKTLAIMQALNGGDGTLMRLIGASNLDSDDPIAYVEYVTGMTLKEYLMSKHDATWPEKLWIASQIAKAITHIHNLGLMHRDVSWSYVFVDDSGNVKVFAGFKMRQVQAYETYLTKGITEARWGAPEILPKPQGGANAKLNSSATAYTDKIDIFGLGLILISLVTRDVPFGYVLKTSGRRTPIDDNLVTTWLKKRETAIPMLTQSFDDDYACPSEEYKKLALECIQFDPELRPTAPEIVRRLEMIRQAYGGGGFTTPDVTTVDLTIAVLKTSRMRHPTLFGTPYEMWCELHICDETRDPIQLQPVTGTFQHLFNQYATLHDIEPLAHTIAIFLKTSSCFSPRRWGSLTAVRTKTCPIFKEGDIVGFLDVAVQFGERLRGYLELFERRTTEYLRNTEVGPSTLDLRKKRDVAAQALASPPPIDSPRPTPLDRINGTEAAAAPPLARVVNNVPSVAGLTASAARLEALCREMRLYTAASNGELDEVDTLLQEGVDPNCCETLLARAPLHCASSRGNVVIVESLLQANADVNVLDANGCSPLDLATTSGHLDVCALLQATVASESDLLSSFREVVAH